MEQVLHPPSVRPFPVRAPRAVAFALAVCAALAACGPATPSAGDGPSARDPSAATPAGPVARRIVSLAPSFTEILVAIGASDALVGIGRFDPDVPGRPDLPRLGDSFSVGLESLLALEPDLVLVNSRSTADALRPAASEVDLVAPPTDRMDDVLALIDDLGRRSGHVRQAADLRRTIDAALAAARVRAGARAARGEQAPRVLVVVERRPLYAAGRTSFVADLLRAVGAENAVDDVEQPWPSLSEEAAVARAPDVILDASEGDNATPEGRAALLEGWSRFPSIPAVRDGRVLVIREDSIFRGGPRIPEALAKLEALLFPEDSR